MRNLGWVLGTCAIVVCGLVAYDQLRARPAEPVDVRPPVETARPGAPPDDGEVGRRLDTLATRLGELERRLSALESKPPSTAEPAAPERAASPRDVADFRAMLEEVERQRTRETASAEFRAQVRTLSLPLTPEQEDAVVAETVRLKEKVQALPRGDPSDPRAVDDRLRALARIRDEWTRAVREAVPGAPGDQVVAALGRPIGGQWPGVQGQPR